MQQVVEGRAPSQVRMCLESAGLPALVEGIPVPVRDRYTWHDYVRSVVEPDPDLGDLDPQVAHIFKCEQTGVERKYGVESLKRGMVN